MDENMVRNLACSCGSKEAGLVFIPSEDRYQCANCICRVYAALSDFSVNVYTCNEFKGHWPVGAAAVVVAKDKPQAVRLLKAELKRSGLEQDISAKKLNLVSTAVPTVIMLHDGDY